MRSRQLTVREDPDLMLKTSAGNYFSNLKNLLKGNFCFSAYREMWTWSSGSRSWSLYAHHPPSTISMWLLCSESINEWILHLFNKNCLWSGSVPVCHWNNRKRCFLNVWGSLRAASTNDGSSLQFSLSSPSLHKHQQPYSSNSVSSAQRI